MRAERAAGGGLLAAAAALLLLNLGWVVTHCDRLRPLELGAPAPPFELRRAGGAPPVRLGDLRGKVVLIDFWAEWCGPCKQTMPMLAELERAHGAEGLVVLSVNVDRDALVDSRTGQAYHADVIPHMMVVDRAGRLRAEHTGVGLGGVGALRKALEGEIRRYLGEPP